MLRLLLLLKHHALPEELLVLMGLHQLGVVRD
jgi:hypothetical protein